MENCSKDPRFYMMDFFHEHLYYDLLWHAQILNQEIEDFVDDFNNDEAMREDVLKAVGDILGLVPKKKYESRAKKPCVCGRKRLELWYGSDGGVEIICPVCRRSMKGKNELEATKKWNKTVEDSRLEHPQ